MNTVKIDNEGNMRYYNEDGVLHRIDGPAIEFFDGRGIWYSNGVKISPPTK